MFSPSLWFVIVSKTLLLCLVGNLTIPIPSWNREMKAYLELKDLEDHGVGRYKKKNQAGDVQRCAA